MAKSWERGEGGLVGPTLLIQSPIGGAILTLVSKITKLKKEEARQNCISQVL